MGWRRGAQGDNLGRAHDTPELPLAGDGEASYKKSIWEKVSTPRLRCEISWIYLNLQCGLLLSDKDTNPQLKTEGQQKLPLIY